MTTPSIVSSHNIETAKVASYTWSSFATVTPEVGLTAVVSSSNDGVAPTQSALALSGTSSDLPIRLESVGGLAGSTCYAQIKAYPISSSNLRYWSTITNNTSLTDAISELSSLCISEDGLHLYGTDSVWDRIYQFRFNTAFDIQTAVYEGALTISTVTTPRGGYIAGDGSRFYIGTTDSTLNVYEYVLTTPYDLLGGHTVNTYDFTGNYGLWFIKNNPKRVYFSNGSTEYYKDVTVDYDLSTAGAPTTTAAMGEMGIATFAAPPTFSPNGRIAKFDGSMFDLFEPFDMSTSVHVANSYGPIYTVFSSNTSVIELDTLTRFYEYTHNPLATQTFDHITTFGGSEELCLAVTFVKDVDYRTTRASSYTGNSNTATAGPYVRDNGSMRWIMAAWDSAQFPHSATSPLTVASTGQTTGGGSGSTSLTTAYVFDETAEVSHSIGADGSDDWRALLLEFEGIFIDPAKKVSINSILALYSDITVTATEVPSAFLVAEATVTAEGIVSPHNFGKVNAVATATVHAPRPLRVTSYAFEQVVDESTTDFIGGINKPIVLREDFFATTSSVNKIKNEEEHSIFACRVRFLVENISNEAVTFKPYNVVNIPNKTGRHVLSPEHCYITQHFRTYQYVSDPVSGISTTALMEFVQPTVWENSFTAIGSLFNNVQIGTSVNDLQSYTYESNVDNESTILFNSYMQYEDGHNVYKYDSTAKQYTFDVLLDPSIGAHYVNNRLAGPRNMSLPLLSSGTLAYYSTDDDFATSNYLSASNIEVFRTAYWNNKLWAFSYENSLSRLILYEAIASPATSWSIKQVFYQNVGTVPSDTRYHSPDNLIIEVDPTDSDTLYVITVFEPISANRVFPDRVYTFTFFKYSISTNVITFLHQGHYPIPMALGNHGDHPFDGQQIQYINSYFANGKIHVSSQICSPGQMYAEFTFDVTTSEYTFTNKEVSAAAIFGELDTSHHQLAAAGMGSVLDGRFESSFPVDINVTYGHNTLYERDIDFATLDKGGYLIPLVKPFVDSSFSIPVGMVQSEDHIQGNFVSYSYDSVADKIRGFSLTSGRENKQTQAHQSNWYSHNLVSRQTNQKIGTGTYATTNLCRYDTGRCFDETTIPANSEVEISIPVYFMSDGYVGTVGVKGSLGDSYVSIRDEYDQIATYKPARAMFSHREAIAVSAKCDVECIATVTVKPSTDPYVLTNAKATVVCEGKSRSQFQCNAIAKAKVKCTVLPEEVVQHSWYAEKFGYDELFPSDNNALNKDVYVFPDDLSNFDSSDFGNKDYGIGDLAARFRIQNNTGAEVTINPQIEIQIDNGSWIKTTYNCSDDQIARAPLFLSNHIKYPDERDGYLLGSVANTTSAFELGFIIYGSTNTEYVFMYGNYLYDTYGKYVNYVRATNTFSSMTSVTGPMDNLRTPVIYSWTNSAEVILCCNFFWYKFNVQTRVITELVSPITSPGTTNLNTSNTTHNKCVQTSTPNGSTYLLGAIREVVLKASDTDDYTSYNFFGQFDDTNNNFPVVTFVDFTTIGLDNLTAKISNIFSHPAYVDRFKVIILIDNVNNDIYTADLFLNNTLGNLSWVSNRATVNIADSFTFSDTVFPGAWQDSSGYVHLGLGNTADTGAYAVYNVFTNSVIFPHKDESGYTPNIFCDDFMNWWGEGVNSNEFLFIGNRRLVGTDVFRKRKPTDIHYTVDKFDETYVNDPEYSSRLVRNWRFPGEPSDSYSTETLIPYWNPSDNRFDILTGYQTSVTPRASKLRTFGIGQNHTHGEDTLQKISIGSSFVTLNHSNLGIFDDTDDVTIPDKHAIEITAQLAMDRDWFTEALTGVTSNEKHWIKVRFVDNSISPVTITQRDTDDYLTIWTLPGFAVNGDVSLNAIATVNAIGTKEVGQAGGGQVSATAIATVNAVPYVPTEYEGFCAMTISIDIPITDYSAYKGVPLMQLYNKITLEATPTLYRSGKVSAQCSCRVNAYSGEPEVKGCY